MGMLAAPELSPTRFGNTQGTGRDAIDWKTRKSFKKITTGAQEDDVVKKRSQGKGRREIIA